MTIMINKNPNRISDPNPNRCPPPPLILARPRRQRRLPRRSQCHRRNTHARASNPRLVVSPLSLASPASPRRTTLSPLPRVPRLPSPLPPSDLPRTSRQRRPPPSRPGSSTNGGFGGQRRLDRGVARADQRRRRRRRYHHRHRPHREPSRRQILLHRCPSANPYAPTAAISESPGADLRSTS
ncbi:hypothetical protein DAI22_01g006400 [Oryza sativa Japonica Group]|nr:hypothetical protein DAI22_01g006400 [Oryza sativa Japonica Group]